MVRLRAVLFRRLVLAAALALPGACGGGGSGGGGDGGGVLGTGGPDGVLDVPSGPGVDLDPCGLLALAEIEAQWPHLGPVGEGDPLGSYCSWPLSDAPAGPWVTVGVLGHRLDRDAAGSLEVLREMMSDPVAVDAGDEAFASGDWHYARAGENVINVMATGFAADAGPQVEPLTALAEVVADRLPDGYVGR